jgi:uncharacterized protein involved in exopolysaccharide biosynthesis
MNENVSFNITTVWQVLSRRWKMIAGFVAVVLVIAYLMVSFVLPKYYRSEAVIIASNPQLTDRARMLNKNIEQLYSPYGTGDDLNRLYAIAKLDSLQYQLVHEFDLVKYYHEQDKATAPRRAVMALRDDLEITKTENDELHIVVFTRNKNLSAQIANRLVQLVDSTAARSWRSEYTRSIRALQQSISDLKKQAGADSLSSHTSNRATTDQVQQFESAANEYQLALNNNPSSLIILQAAFPSLTHDKPKLLQVLIGAAFASLAFAALAVLLFDRKNH